MGKMIVSLSKLFYAPIHVFKDEINMTMNISIIHFCTKVQWLESMHVAPGMEFK